MVPVQCLSMGVFIWCSAPSRLFLTHFRSVHQMYTDFDKIYIASLVTCLCRLYRQEVPGASERFLSWDLLNANKNERRYCVSQMYYSLLWILSELTLITQGYGSLNIVSDIVSYIPTNCGQTSIPKMIFEYGMRVFESL
jgi:hypothetical protein